MCCVEGRDGHVRLFSFCSFKTTQLLKNIFSRKISVHLPIYFFLFIDSLGKKNSHLFFPKKSSFVKNNRFFNLLKNSIVQ